MDVERDFAVTEEGTQTRNKETSSVAWTEYKMSNPVVLEKCDLGRDSDGSRETSFLWLDSKMSNHGGFF